MKPKIHMAFDMCDHKLTLYQQKFLWFDIHRNVRDELDITRTKDKHIYCSVVFPVKKTENKDKYIDVYLVNENHAFRGSVTVYGWQETH